MRSDRPAAAGLPADPSVRTPPPAPAPAREAAAGAVRHGRDKGGHSFLIRPFTPADRAALERMYTSFEPKRSAHGLPPVGEGHRNRWLSRVLLEGRHLLVEVEGEVVGHGMLVAMGAGAAELANFLHQSARDRGIGTRLNQALLEEARTLGCHRVWLLVEPSNRRAMRSYEKAGFRRRSNVPCAHELEMEVRLGPVEPPKPPEV
jgi:RimJ/RimL family protein N-acetyltransferase